MVRKITSDTYYVGVNDRTTHLFEGLWSLPYGVSYNSYLIVDEKVALIDTVELSQIETFLGNIEQVLGGRGIDYLIVNHNEPDHSGSIRQLHQLYPAMKIVGNKLTAGQIEGYYGVDADSILQVTDGSTLSLGAHELMFHFTPMVHWPETMMTYDTSNSTLFAGDAFGCFGALNGGCLDTTINIDIYENEMRRYYACIVGKYGNPVQKALNKLNGVPVNTLCPTHGPVWTGENIGRVVSMYDSMSRYSTDNGVVIAYASMYGHTEQTAERLAQYLCDGGIKDVIVHRLNTADPSIVLADIFKYRALLIGSPTYNNNIFPAVESLLSKLSGREVKEHIIGLFGSYTWAGAAVKRMAEWTQSLPNNQYLTPMPELKQARYADTEADVAALAQNCIDVLSNS